MKTLIVYSRTGEIVFTMQSIELQDNYSCIVSDIEEGKTIKSVDVATGTVITEDKDTRVEDITTYLNNADSETISKVEDIILEVETNKITGSEE